MTCHGTHWSKLAQAMHRISFTSRMDGLKDTYHIPTDATWLEPDFAEAVAGLQSVDEVGVLELYDEFVCVLIFHQTGELPAGCSCDSPGTHLNLTHEDHDLHAAESRTVESWRQLPKELIEQADQLTRVDTVSYTHLTLPTKRIV